jgi:MFS family permease
MPADEKPPPSLFRNVIRLGWVSGLTDVSSEMLYAITPLFLTQVLGATPGIVGIIEGIAEGTASILKGLSGWHSDRIRKRKIYILAGYSFSAVAKPLIALAAGWPLVLLARFFDRFGKGVRTTARDALIADSSRPEERGKAFGLHRAMDTAGALVGVAISLVLLLALQSNDQSGSTFRLLYWLAFIPAALGVLLIFSVREVAPAAPKHVPAVPVSLRFGREYYAVLALFAVFTLGNSSDVFLLLRAKQAGLSTEAVIGAYLCYNGVYSLLSYPIGKRADRVSKQLLLAIGFVVFAFVYLGFALLPAAWMVWPLFLIYGLYIALTEGVSKALIANLVTAEVRGTALGLFYLVSGLLAVAASIGAGWLWDHVSVSAPFYAGGGLSLVAALGLWFWTATTGRK